MNRVVDLAEKIFVENQTKLTPKEAFSEATNFLTYAIENYPGCEHHAIRQTDCEGCIEARQKRAST